MKGFRNLRIGTKLMSSFLLVALIAGFVGCLGIVELSRMNHLLDGMYDNNLVPITEIAHANMQAIYHNRAVYDYVLESEKPEMDKVKTAMDGYAARMKEYLDRYRKTEITEKERELLGKFDAAWPVYMASVERILPLSYAGKNDEATVLANGEATKTFQTVDDLLGELVEINVKLGKTAYDESDSVYESSFRFMTILIVLGIAAALGLGYLITRMITGPVREMVAAANSISLGDIDQKIEYRCRDEIGNLADSFRNLVGYIGGIAGVADRISQGDLSADIEAKSEKDVLSMNFIKVTKTLRGLNGEVGMLCKAGVEGRLATRGSHEKFEGGYRDIVKGMNDTLDAVINPLSVAARYVERISKGDTPPRITDEYKGDFNQIKNNLNTLIDAMNEVTSVAGEIANGNLTVTVKERSAEDRLMQAMGRMVGGLTEVVSNIQTVAGQVTSGS
ncbi:MAG: MCP four helix bundle domain-containing protein, partial [Acidobacteriota bacterium]